ncbi:MAG TPA: flavin reductase family protein [Acidobacteriota bacterium]|nr:flavin reductase family protein [Acidobacteriota bacterium]
MSTHNTTSLPATPDTFRQVMSLFPTGVTVVTTTNENEIPYGVTVNAFTSVSLDPLLILVCLDNRLRGLSDLLKVGRFAVNILSEGQETVAIHYSTPGSDRAQGEYVEGVTGLPLIKDALAAIECEVEEALPGGDHTILLGLVKSITLHEEVGRKRPLIYYHGRYERLP